MAKEKLVTIHVHTPFTLTLGDQSKQEFGRGRHNVPEEVASHWFTQAHSELSESVISDTDDLQPIIDGLQAQIADKDKLIADLKDALLKLQEQNDNLQAQITAAGLAVMGLKMSKNQSLPAVSDFRRDFPQFADPAKYPDAQIGFRLNLADELLTENVTGKKLFPYFAGLFVAHYMTLWAADSRAMLAGGPGGSTNGVQSSKSVDKVSVSYDTSATLNPDAGFWNNTRYGAEFYQLITMFGAGGRQL